MWLGLSSIKTKFVPRSGRMQGQITWWQDQLWTGKSASSKLTISLMQALADWLSSILPSIYRMRSMTLGLLVTREICILVPTKRRWDIPTNIYSAAARGNNPALHFATHCLWSGSLDLERGTSKIERSAPNQYDSQRTEIPATTVRQERTRPSLDALSNGFKSSKSHKIAASCGSDSLVGPWWI